MCSTGCVLALLLLAGGSPADGPAACAGSLADAHALPAASAIDSVWPGRRRAMEGAAPECEDIEAELVDRI